ncbi:MAG: alpha/beta hydrolase [Sphingomonadaceae bacterium]|nr:alpha/beta hydrolase [Sphingomonadaceae bacterium]
MSSPRKFEAAPGGAIAYEAFGPTDGEPVIFAHGGGQTRHAWKGAGKALGTKGWRAIAYDHRGHGDSDWAPEGDYAMERFGGDLVALAEHLAPDGQRPHVVGASLGGIAALVAEGALKPGSFATVTLVDIVPRMTAGGVDRITGFMRTHSADGFASLEEAADAIAEYLPHRPRPKSLGGLRKNLRERGGRWYWHWDPAFMTERRGRHAPEWLDRLEAATRAIACPLHLVRGRSSELVDEDAAARFRALVPDAAYTDVAGARHMVAGDRNDVFVEAVEGFLETHRQTD